MLEDSESPSVVLYNLVITDSAGIDFVGTLSGSIGKTPLVVMCDRDDPELMRGCIERGAKAFLPSTTPGPVLVSVLRLIIAGGLYAPPDLLLKYYDTSMRSATGGQASVRREAAIAENFPMLTPRQRDVLALLSQGQSNRDIAEALNMCENTVKAHVKQVMRKLNADNRTQAALMADRLIA
jgi:DNA-binding NarL/FixJ family response regulator